MSTRALERIPRAAERAEFAAEEIKAIEIARADGTEAHLAEMERLYPDHVAENVSDQFKGYMHDG